MPFTIQLTKKAKQFVEKADKKLQQRLQRTFDQIAQNLRQHPNIKPLRGEFEGLWRYRLGDYRIVYEIRDDAQVVIVLVIARRGDVYDK